MRFLFLLNFLLAAGGAQCLFAQNDYTQWFTGDTADVITAHRAGLVLAGGATDNDDAMRWMLQRADDGDVVVIRASQSDGYNDYFFSELGIPVNSVQTIRFDGPAAAHDAYVLQQIRNAEVLFIAGGDQYDYYSYWKDTPVEDALNYLLNEKQITVGGTSAGMAILGQAYYTPSDAGIYSSEALSDPYHPYMEVLGSGDFLQHPLLADLVTDTHFEQRERQGRLLTFLARLTQDHDRRFFAIAANEYSVVCVDENGLARAYGEWPEYDDYVFFLQTNCLDNFQPEVIEAGQPLTWKRFGAAVKAYRLPGTVDGSHTFLLSDWASGQGGDWENWYAEEGAFQIVPQTGPQCDELVLDRREAQMEKLPLVRLFPNPTQSLVRLLVEGGQTVEEVILFNPLGRPLRKWAGSLRTLVVDDLAPGAYHLQIQTGGRIEMHRLVKQ